MCFQLADLLEEEEEWSEAARVLMSISMDSGYWYAIDIIRTVLADKFIGGVDCTTFNREGSCKFNHNYGVDMLLNNNANICNDKSHEANNSMTKRILSLLQLRSPLQLPLFPCMFSL